jgi:PhnB protein
MALTLNAHLTFNGTCEAAFLFYEKCFGGKIVAMMRYGDSPMAEGMPRDWHGKIIHATLALGEQRLSGADVPPESYQKPQGFFVLVGIGTATEADRIWRAMTDGGTVQMAIQETFWALGFGMVVDRFGIPWMINCERPV